MSAFSGLYSPFAHVVHSLEPATETWVALHGVHEATKLAANTAENVSIWHGVHKAFPFATAVYVPAAHDTQSDSCERASWPCVDFPATHGTQVVILVAAVLVEYVPAIHGVHVCVPLAVLYVPAAHIVHVPPSAPTNPALQIQSTSSLLAMRAFDAVGQDWQVEISVAPTSAEYFPMSHATQIAMSFT